MASMTSMTKEVKDESSIRFVIDDTLTPYSSKTDVFCVADRGTRRGSKAGGIELLQFCERRGRVTVSDKKSSITLSTLRDTYPLHGLVGAIHLAFQNHLDLSLKPDHFWIVILQTLAKQIATNPEKYREILVSHKEGKETIIVENDSLTANNESSKNKEEWEKTMDEMVRIVTSKTEGKLTSVLKSAGKFSTTGRAESMAANVAIMQAVEAYFEYEVRTKCGIRSVNLQGTAADWSQLRAAVDALPLESLDLGGWRMPLQEIMLGLEATALGRGESSMAQVEFWKNIYKYQASSGSDKCTGWLLFLFPLISGGKEWMTRTPRKIPGKEYEAMVEKKFKEPTNLSELLKVGYSARPCGFGSGLAATKFVWRVAGRPIPMQLHSGFGDHLIADDLLVSPSLGWTITNCT